MEEDHKLNIQKIFNDFEIYLPNGLIKNKFIEDLSKKTDPLLIAKFFDSLKLKDYVKEESLSNLFDNISKVENRLEPNKKTKLLENDLFIVKLLFKQNNLNGKPAVFMKMFSGINYLNGIGNELEDKDDKLSNILKAVILLYLFQDILELLSEFFEIYLAAYDPKAYNDYKNKKSKKNKKNKKDKKHLSVGEIGQFISDILKNKDKSKDNIFSKNADLRNAIAHGNIIFDKDTNEFLLTENGECIKMRDFELKYAELFELLIMIFENMVETPNGIRDKDKIIEKFYSYFEGQRKDAAHKFRNISRNYRAAWNIKMSKYITTIETKENGVQ